MLNKSTTLDLTFQALADPTRRLMLAQLARGPTSVSELARPLAMSLPGVMQHLAVLEGSGLVRSKKVGRVRTCRIETQALTLAEQWLNHRRMEWEGHLDRLGEALEVARMGLVAAQRDHQAWIAPRWEIWRGWLLLQQGQLSDAGAALEGAFAAESIRLRKICIGSSGAGERSSMATKAVSSTSEAPSSETVATLPQPSWVARVMA